MLIKTPLLHHLYKSYPSPLPFSSLSYKTHTHTHNIYKNIHKHILSMAILPPYNICFPPKTKQELDQESSIYRSYDYLISTLPSSTQTHLSLSLFNGFWFPNGNSFGLNVLHGTLAARDHFLPRSGDILLSTLPKVGTTWLKALAFATLHRSNSDHQSLLLSLNPHQCVPFLEYQLYANDRIPDLDALPSPRLLSTHIPYSLLPPPVLLPQTRCKIVYLCRNPMDTFVSMWKFANSLVPDSYERAPLDEFVEVFLSGVYTSGPFWDNVIEYWNASRESPERVMFMKYEDLKRSPETEVKRLAGFMGCPFTEEEVAGGAVDGILRLCSLESLRGLEVNRTTATEFWRTGFDNRAFFRKGEVGDWVNYLTPEMAERFGRVTEEKFGAIGLSFE